MTWFHSVAYNGILSQRLSIAFTQGNAFKYLKTSKSFPMSTKDRVVLLRLVSNRELGLLRRHYNVQEASLCMLKDMLC